MNIISDAKKGAFKDTVYAIINSAETEYMTNKLHGDSDKKITYTYENNIETSNIEGRSLKYKGTKPQSGSLIVTKDGKISLALYDGTYCVKKVINEDDITISKVDKDDCILDATQAKIILTGLDTIEITPNTPYSEPGYSGFDNEENDVTSKVKIKIYKNNIEQENIDTSITGEYTIKYIYEDDNDYVEVSRRLIIIDTEAPNLVISGDITLVTTEVSSFDLLEGVTVTDNSGEEIVVDISGNISSIVGDYTITYKAKDSSGNETSKTRIIKVIKQSYLMVAASGNEQQAYLNSPFGRNKIESLKYTNTRVVPSNVIGSWDVSADKNKSVMAWYTDDDNNGLYEMTIGSPGGVKANPDCNGLYNNLINLTTLVLNNFDTQNVTSMKSSFTYLKKLTTLDLSSINTSKVTDMSFMFYGMSSLTSLNLTGLNTSKVTTMTNMFYGVSSLTSLNINSFNTSLVTDMGGMFYGMTSLTTLNTNNFNTTNVTNMGRMFANTSNLTSLNLSNFNTSKVTTMEAMFWGMSSLTTLNISKFNTTNVKDMSWMFVSVSNLTSLNVSSFNTTSVTDMSNMFSGMKKLTTLDLINFNTSSLTTIDSMFRGMESLNSLDFRKADFSSDVNRSSLFSGVKTGFTLYVKNATMKSLLQTSANLVSGNIIVV